MKILICTGIYPPQVGGPAQYAKQIEDEFRRQGHSIKMLTYGLERKLPPLVRHFLFFGRSFFAMFGVDFVIALDTFSVGFPAVCAANLIQKKIIIRTGGDFLWESYVERTGEEIILPDFYKVFHKKINFKERLIFLITRFTFENVNAVIFSTSWQRDIFTKAYELKEQKNYIIENEYSLPFGNFEAKSRTYLWAGRMIKLKNIDRLKRAFNKAQLKDPTIKLSLLSNITKKELVEKMKECYAVILPSFSDISPNFILEAISFGKPSILTKEIGIAERVKDTVLFVDPLDENDIENKILFMANDKNYQDLKRKVGEFSFSHSIKQITEEFLAVYSQIKQKKKIKK